MKIFEISGIGHPNKGAELMLFAAGEALKNRFGDGTVITTIPTARSDAGYRCAASYGYRLRFSYCLRGRDFGPFLARFLPGRLLRSHGCYGQHDIDCVLDASGLRYSDKWGAGTMQRAIRDYRRVRKNGSKVILLPQAFGPFEKPDVRKLVPELIALADLVYVRDAVSKEILEAVVGQQEKIRLAPDFTALAGGVRPDDGGRFADGVCVVPNARMLDMTDPKVGENYIQLLLHAIRRLKDGGFRPFILNHEGRGDEVLCSEIASRFAPELPYTGQRTALEIKGIIGASKGLLTSRFHGLVSGFCQGVPSVCTSWNHKYEELCRTYESPNSILDPSQPPSKNDVVLDEWIAELSDGSMGRKQALKAVAGTEKEKIRKMWDEVFALIE